MQDIFVEDIGNGTPLVLIHGFLGSSDMWNPQIEFFKDDFRVIAPALPGFGKSSTMNSCDSIQCMAESIINTLEKRKIKSFNLLGHSMGGMIVQEMAALFPQRVNKLICFGTGSIGVLPSRFETIDESRAKIKKFGIDKARKDIAKTWFVDHSIGGGYKLCLDEGSKATTQAALASLDAWESWDGRAQLSQILSPTLILWANKDRSYDWNQQVILNQGISNSKVEIIDGCAHNSHMEKPDLINTIIKNFFFI